MIFFFFLKLDSHTYIVYLNKKKNKNKKDKKTKQNTHTTEADKIKVHLLIWNLDFFSFNNCSDSFKTVTCDNIKIDKTQLFEFK